MLYRNGNLLKRRLQETTRRVELLGLCLKHVLGGECSPKPSLPGMPKYLFERKQWGHALLTSAKDYTGWLYKKFLIQVLKVQQPSRIKQKAPRAVLQKYELGGKYLLWIRSSCRGGSNFEGFTDLNLFYSSIRLPVNFYSNTYWL